MKAEDWTKTDRHDDDGGDDDDDDRGHGDGCYDDDGNVKIFQRELKKIMCIMEITAMMMMRWGSWEMIKNILILLKYRFYIWMCSKDD